MVQFKLDGDDKGSFFIQEGDARLGEMVVSIDKQNITVYHTQVSDQLKGQGAGTQLLTAMVNYARANNLKVIPLCPFVRAQFQRHEDLYRDVWNKEWHQ